MENEISPLPRLSAAIAELLLSKTNEKAAAAITSGRLVPPALRCARLPAEPQVAPEAYLFGQLTPRFGDIAWRKVRR
jgi:hypothetical protein